MKNNQNTHSSLIFEDTVVLSSATSMKSSRRDLSNNMAENRSILKIIQKKHHLRF